MSSRSWGMNPGENKGLEMSNPKPMTKKMREEAHDSKTGVPMGNGPKCATCGLLAVYGEHRGCETDSKKRLMVWVQVAK